MERKQKGHSPEGHRSPSSKLAAVFRCIGSKSAIAGVLLVGFLTPVAVSQDAAFAQPSVEKGVLLIASPSMNDPNFSRTVVLIVEHGPQGTIGVILNRSTKVLLSEALPDVSALKGTKFRLFAGGPVDPTRLLLLFRLTDPQTDAISVFDGVYVGGAPKILEQIIARADPKEKFRAFAGFAGWAPGQLNFEMVQGAWAILSARSIGIFDEDPGTLWQDCISRLQAPKVISN